jgi:hypothetical protein
MPCHVGAALVNDAAPCKALEKCKDKFYCGLMTNPHKYINIVDPSISKTVGLVIAKIIGSGWGCESSPETEMLKKIMWQRFKKSEPK